MPFWENFAFLGNFLFWEDHLCLDPSVSWKPIFCEKKKVNPDFFDFFLFLLQATLLVTSNTDATAYKTQTAMKLKIPVVSMNYLVTCEEKQQCLEPDTFLVVGKSATENFGSGKIVAKRSRVETTVSAGGMSSSSTGIKRLKIMANLRDVKVFPFLDPKSPVFDETLAVVAKKVVLVREEPKLAVTYFLVLELHARSGDGGGPNSLPFRIFTHSGMVPKGDAPPQALNTVKECRFLGNVWDAEDAYAQLYNDHERKGYKRGALPSGIHYGSPLLQQERENAGFVLPEAIKELIDEIYAEADAELATTMHESVGVPTLVQIEEGEGKSVPCVPLGFRRDCKMNNLLLLSFFFFFLYCVALLHAITKDLLANGKENPARLAKLSKEFYAAVPGQKDQRPIADGVVLAQKQKLCRLLKDMVSVSETTGWAPSSASEAKYRSLNCSVAKLDEGSQEYRDLMAHLEESNHRQSHLMVERVYVLARGMEEDNFKVHLKNKRNLFHSSDFKNFVGLLSRYAGYALICLFPL